MDSTPEEEKFTPEEEQEIAREVEQTSQMSKRIGERLTQLGYENEESLGNLEYRLAEIWLMAKKVSEEYLPQLLARDLGKDALHDSVVDLHVDLMDLRDQIEEVQDDLIKLMNFIGK